MRLVNCLLWVLQKIVELIAHEAYVIVAIDGTGFCGSAVHATGLMASNMVRMATLTVVSDGLLFLGKLGTAASSAFFTFVYLDKTYPAGKLSSPLVPVIVVFLTAFAIASVGFGVVEQAINTTMLAMCDDEDKNGGAAKWAPPALMEATDVAKAHEAAVAEKKKHSRSCCSGGVADAETA